MAKSPAGIDIEEDRPFQERFWSFQRFAWLLLALIMLTALVGLTGQGGMLAHAEASAGDASIDYPRVTRWEASDEFRLTVPGASNRVAVEIGPAFSKVFEYEDIQPVPVEHYATGDGQRLIFDLGEPAGDREIVFHVRAMRPSLGAPMQFRVNGALVFLHPVILP